MFILPEELVSIHHSPPVIQGIPPSPSYHHAARVLSSHMDLKVSEGNTRSGWSCPYPQTSLHPARSQGPHVSVLEPSAPTPVMPPAGLVPGSPQPSFAQPWAPQDGLTHRLVAWPSFNLALPLEMTYAQSWGYPGDPCLPCSWMCGGMGLGCEILRCHPIGTLPPAFC